MTKPTIETGCLIGGPLDGQRVSIPDATIHDFRTEAGAYRKELLDGDRAAFAVWRWHDVPVDDAILMLCEGYRVPKPA